MKNIYKNQFIIRTSALLCILFFALFNTSAQETTDEHPLVGTWSFDPNSFEIKMSANSKMQLDTIPQVKQTFKTAYNGRKETFAPDGTYSVVLADGRSALAKWTLQNKNILLISHPDGFVQQNRISILTESKLVLVPIGSGDTKHLMSELHFIKN
nr:hypothetical protein [uncultured Allomuricauda sp.]